MQNLTAGQLPDNKNPNLSAALKSLQMQLNNTSSVSNTKNMAEVKARLKQAGEQLDVSFEGFGVLDTQTTKIQLTYNQFAGKQ